MATANTISKHVNIVPTEVIERKIFLIRRKKVMLDADLADLYGVATKRLNEQVKRNKDRFPHDFMFQLNAEESSIVDWSHIATGSGKHRDPRFKYYAFTEHGVAMLSAVLKSPRAVEMSVFIVRTFVKLREMLATHKDLAQKMKALEDEQTAQGQQLAKVCRIIKNLLDEPIVEKEPIGFRKD